MARAFRKRTVRAPESMVEAEAYLMIGLTGSNLIAPERRIREHQCAPPVMNMHDRSRSTAAPMVATMDVEPRPDRLMLPGALHDFRFFALHVASFVTVVTVCNLGES